MLVVMKRDASKEEIAGIYAKLLIRGLNRDHR